MQARPLLQATSDWRGLCLGREIDTWNKLNVHLVGENAPQSTIEREEEKKDCLRFAMNFTERKFSAFYGQKIVHIQRVKYVSWRQQVRLR